MGAGLTAASCWRLMAGWLAQGGRDGPALSPWCQPCGGPGVPSGRLVYRLGCVTPCAAKSFMLNMLESAHKTCNRALTPYHCTLQKITALLQHSALAVPDASSHTARGDQAVFRTPRGRRIQSELKSSRGTGSESADSAVKRP